METREEEIARIRRLREKTEELIEGVTQELVRLSKERQALYKDRWYYRRELANLTAEPDWEDMERKGLLTA